MASGSYNFSRPRTGQRGEQALHYDPPFDYNTLASPQPVSSIQDSEHFHTIFQSSPYQSSPYHGYSPPAEKAAWPANEYENEPRAASTAPEVVEVGLHHPRPAHGHHRAYSPAFSSQSTNVEYPVEIPKPYQPGYYQDGLEVRQSFIGPGKEVYQAAYMQAVPTEKPERRICGCSRILFFVLLFLLILILGGLGAGLGAGLGLKHGGSDNTPKYTGNEQLAIGGVLDPAYYSTKGAFNGSGIAFAGESFVDDEHGIFTVYFQHWTGDLRWIQLSAEGTYIGGRITETVATDAKNSTPISVVAYALNSTSKWHVFYVGVDGYLKQKSNSNVTNIWQDGPLTSLQLQPLNADSLGLQACWYGNFYGDSDASKFPTASGQTNQQAFDISKGMHLWYASDEETFQQYGIYEGQEQWVFEKEWSGFNGHAGVGCYSWLPGDVTYAMLVDLNNTVDIYWKDTNTTTVPNATHPINEWVKAPNCSIPNAYPSTSLGYTTYFYAQLENTQINGYNITFDSEATQIANEIVVSDTSGPVNVLGGTHMTCSAVGNPSGGASLYVFAQDQGDDISVYTRDLTGGQWSSGTLPIPDD